MQGSAFDLRGYVEREPVDGGNKERLENSNKDRHKEGNDGNEKYYENILTIQ